MSELATLTVATQILARMEMYHLDAWLQHLQRHDVTRVWIFMDSDWVVDTRMGQHTPLRIWVKKPETNFNLDWSAEECYGEILRIVNRRRAAGMDIRILPVMSNFADVGHRQKHSSNWLVRLFRDNSDIRTNWLCFLDVDEYLVVYGSSLREHLTLYYHHPVAAIIMRQRLFESRFQDGKAIPVEQISRHYGVTRHAPKVIFNPMWTQLKNVHNAKARGRRRTMADHHELLFHHFRGRPSVIFPGDRHSLLKYRRMTRHPHEAPNTDHVPR